jgi:tRNA-dihydrouridine synthase B
MIRAYFEMLLAEAEATRDLPRDARLGETAGKMKQFATWFTHGVPGGGRLRKAIYQAKTGEEVLEQVNAFFASQPPVDVTFESDSPAFPEASLVCD